MFFSCGQSSAEKTLIGRWSETNTKDVIWHFYPGSLVITEDPFIKVQWEATRSKIKLEYPSTYWTDSGKPVDTVDHIVIDYKLSNNEDTLTGTLTNLFGIHEFGLIRNEE